MTTPPPNGSDAAHDTIPVYILAGGRSRRFGRDKARALHDGVPLVVGVARALEPVASRVTIVAAGGGAYDDLGLRTIGDVVPEKGPIGGLLTAIEDCRPGEWLLLAACDWVGVRAEWVLELLASRGDLSGCVVFKSDRYQPMFALYHTSIRETVAAQIEAGRLSMQQLYPVIATVALPLPDDWDRATNLNRPPG
jgi:molybdopterin-guanine dinucleotide biosynthesis protein A